jgi:hypothetical protein
MIKSLRDYFQKKTTLLLPHTEEDEKNIDSLKEISQQIEILRTQVNVNQNTPKKNSLIVKEITSLNKIYE